MFVATIRNKQKGRVYETHLIRHTYREGGKVRNKTVANITKLPPETREVIRRSLRGETLIPASSIDVLSSRGHGHVALVRGVLRDCGLRNILSSRDTRERRLVEGLLVARILQPLSKLATTRWWLTTTLAEDLDLEDAVPEELYAVLDWLAAQQPRIEKRLAKKRLHNGSLVLYDLSSSYLTGRHCPLGKRGYSRDGKPGSLQVVYGVICDGDGCPVAVQVYPGNTNDTTTLMEQVDKVQDRFGLERLVIVADRGTIKQTRIEELRKREGVDWISALNAPQLKALYGAGELQLGLFDERNLVEITSGQFPGERLVVCRNPLLAAERKRKRQELLDATEERLRKVQVAVEAGRLANAGAIGERVGRCWKKQKMRKHFQCIIEDGHFHFDRKLAGIQREEALDGLYVIRTSLADKEAHPADEVVRSYKRLSSVERVFRAMKTTQLLVRPIFHWTPTRVRAHIFLCMLGAHVLWHLERRLASLLFREEDRAERTASSDPVVALERSDAAKRKDAEHTSDDDLPLHSLKTLLAEMATLQRHTMRATGSEATWEQVSVPSEHQRRVFDLASVKVP